MKLSKTTELPSAVSRYRIAAKSAPCLENVKFRGFLDAVRRLSSWKVLREATALRHLPSECGPLSLRPVVGLVRLCPPPPPPVRTDRP